MVSIRASLGFTAAVLALVSVSACSKKPAEDTTTTAPTETAASEPAATNAAAPAADTKVAADNTDTLAGVKYASYTGDAAAGEKSFAVCKTCHAVEAGKNMVGPSLHGIVGRTAGSIAGFTYSAANKGSGIVWSEAKLFQYLEAPQRIVPGTKMTYTGLKDPQARANVIAYLKTQS
jgi:cytochrome c